MFPKFSIHNVVDRLEANSEANSNRSLSNLSSGVKSPNLDYIVLSKNTHRIFLSLPRLWISPSAFVFGILNILLRGSNPKVFWITTRRIVASMAHIFRSIVIPECDDVSNSVGSHVLSKIIENSVISSIFCPRPNPAFINPRFLNMRPKSFGYFGWFSKFGNVFVKSFSPSEFTGSILSSHKSARLIFATLPDAFTSRGHFIFIFPDKMSIFPRLQPR